MIAALFVETNGVYSGLANVDPWDEARDARLYSGPYPVVAHPPCERWGRFWHGSTRKPHVYRLGEDGGCFFAALWSVRTFGGVLEHPADSLAWSFFGIAPPRRGGGWLCQIPGCGLGIECKKPGHGLGFSCYVEQGHYGHFSRKPTWLYACKVKLPELHWTRLPQRLHPIALEKYGYEKARRIGVMAMVGGKNKKQIRNATPVEFRDVLLAIAEAHTPALARTGTN